MNIHVLVPCAVLAGAGLFITACNRKESAPETPPANDSTAAADAPAAPSPAGPTDAEQKLAEQIRELEAKQAGLQLQMEEERLAATEAEIAKERELLKKEREAWRLELELADAKAALPVPGKKTVVPVVGGAVSTSSPGYDYQMFYDDLEPLGSWLDSPDYGYVWQPSIYVSDHSWRPYTHGRWACSDLGWTWCSDEPFGWACYHYGRWAQLRGIGWVWVPGDQWAPSWVAWRRNERYVGWCPLPPETVYDRDCTWGDTIDRDCGIDPGGYVFVPVRHFDEPVLGYCEAPSICLTICRTTVNITNIIIRPGRVECPGPRYDWIRDCVRRPVPRYTIACDSERREHRHGRGHRIEKDRIHCFAPGVRAPWNAELRPSRTAAIASGAEVVRGEGGLPGKLGTRFRQERERREQTAQNPGGSSGRALAERQQRLAGLEKTREALHEKLRLESEAAKAAAPSESVSGKLAGNPGREGKSVNRAVGQPDGQAVNLRGDKRELVANRVEPTASRTNDTSAVPATPAPSARPATRPAIGPVANPSVVASENSRLVAAREELAKLRAERAAAAKTGAEQPQRASAPGPNDKRAIVSRARNEATRPQQEDAPKAQASNPAARERAAMEHEQRDARAAVRNDAAARESEKQTAARAALDERRRQLEAQKEQAAQERAAIEQQRRGEDAKQSRRDEVAAREQQRQSAARDAAEERRHQQQQEEAQNDAAKQQAANERAAMDQQRRKADVEARAEQLAQQRAAVEQQRRQAETEARAEQQQRQREAMEQSRRQAEVDARAEQQARQREAVEQQRRQAEAEARAEQQQRQREAMEQQRRQADEQNRQEQQRRQSEEQSRRHAEEQSRRQSEEQSRRQAEEQSRRQADEQRARESSERESKGRR